MNNKTTIFITHTIAALVVGGLLGFFISNPFVAIPLTLISAALIATSHMQRVRAIDKKEEENGN